LCPSRVESGSSSDRSTREETEQKLVLFPSRMSGMSFEDVQRKYHLTIKDVVAALKFAGELVNETASSSPCRRRMIERGEQMTIKEREKFRQGLRGPCRKRAGRETT